MELEFRHYVSEYGSKNRLMEINSRRQHITNLLNYQEMTPREIIKTIGSCYKIDVIDLAGFYKSLFQKSAKFSIIKTEVLGNVFNKVVQPDVIIWSDLESIKPSYAIKELEELVLAGRLVVVNFLNQDELVNTPENMQNVKRLYDISLDKVFADMSDLGPYFKVLYPKILAAFNNRDIRQDLRELDLEYHNYLKDLEETVGLKL